MWLAADDDAVAAAAAVAWMVIVAIAIYCHFATHNPYLEQERESPRETYVEQFVNRKSDRLCTVVACVCVFSLLRMYVDHILHPSNERQVSVWSGRWVGQCAFIYADWNN